jgi:hypothetical protein
MILFRTAARPGQDGAGSGGVGVDADKAIVALLGLAVADREERLTRSGPARADSQAPARRSEALLADAGLSVSEITQVTGKDYEAVKWVLRQDREARETRKRTSRPTGAIRQDGSNGK